VKTVHIALGGVAHKPWRASIAEQMLTGQPITDTALRNAAAAAMGEAQPLSGNRFKVQLAQRSIVRAVNQAAGRTGGVA
jgi:xanthine dehydrogenase YagS FAD-binding subunit